MQFDAIVLAGGEGRRLGGEDKAALELGGRTLLDGALLALSAATRVIVAGPRRPTVTPVTWTRETPHGGGPLAATAAGTRHVAAPVVFLLAVDYPFVDGAVVGTLLEALGEHDGAALGDGEGRIHYVVGAYRTASLQDALHRAGDVTGASMRRVLGTLDIVEIVDEDAARDIDSPEDLSRAHRLLDGL